MNVSVFVALRRVLLGIVLVLVAGTSVSAEEHTKDRVEDVLKLVKEKKALLVDVREKAEWEKGHLKDAKLIPLSSLGKNPNAEEIAKLLGKEKVVYVHCASGYRCLEAAPLLRKLGYEVKALEPGYKQLLKAGFEQAPEEKKTEPK
ncbi:MAG: rhodanese-like domain-containing protein [Pirellulales bacterium]